MFALTMLAQVARVWNFADLAIAAIVVAGVIAVVVIVVNALHLPIPPWVWTLLGVVILIVCAILSVRIIASM